MDTQFTNLHSRGQNAEEDTDNLGLSLLAGKTIDEFEFEERLERV